MQKRPNLHKITYIDKARGSGPGVGVIQTMSNHDATSDEEDDKKTPLLSSFLSETEVNVGLNPNSIQINPHDIHTSTVRFTDDDSHLDEGSEGRLGSHRHRMSRDLGRSSKQKPTMRKLSRSLSNSSCKACKMEMMSFMGASFRTICPSEDITDDSDSISSIDNENIRSSSRFSRRSFFTGDVVSSSGRSIDNLRHCYILVPVRVKRFASFWADHLSSLGGILTEHEIAELQKDLSLVGINDESDSLFFEIDRFAREGSRNFIPNEHYYILIPYNIYFLGVTSVFYGIADSFFTSVSNQLTFQYNDLSLDDIYVQVLLAVVLPIIASGPISYLADSTRKDAVLKLGYYFYIYGSLIIIMVIIFALLFEERGQQMSVISSSLDKSWSIWFSLGFWWSGSALFLGSLMAYLSDSCPVGERSFYVAFIYSCRYSFQIIGYLSNLILNFNRDDLDWKLSDAQAMILSGLVFSIIMAPPLLNLKDDAILPKKHTQIKNTAIESRGSVFLQLIEAQSEEIENQLNIKRAARNLSIPDDDSSAANNRDKVDNENAFQDALLQNQNQIVRRLVKPCWCVIRRISAKHVPILIIMIRSIMNFATGFGLNNYSNFLFDEVDLDIAANSIFFVFLPLLSIASMICAAILAFHKGRGEVCFLFHVFALISLFLVVILNICFDEPSLYYFYPCLVIFTGGMIGPIPLEVSILMDYANEHFRARWLTVYTVTEYFVNLATFSSSGVIHRKGYNTVFAIQDALQFVGVVFIFLMIPFIPMEKSLRHLTGSAVEEEKMVKRQRSHPIPNVS